MCIDTQGPHEHHAHDDPVDGHSSRVWPARIGIGGPVGSGKTSLLEGLVPRLLARGHRPIVITNDIVTREDAEHVVQTLADTLDPARVVGVQTGSCPHSAVREDPTMNLAALEELVAHFPDADVALIESGGDNLTLTFSRALVDYQIYVIDVAGGDKIPRKRGAGIVTSDLLVINKVDLAPHVGASLAIMERDARLVRAGRPFLFTNCRTGAGLDVVVDHVLGAIRGLSDDGPGALPAAPDLALAVPRPLPSRR